MRACTIILGTVFVLLFTTTGLGQETKATNAHTMRQARAEAEAMIRASGPLRDPAPRPYMPAAWEPNRQLAGTYADPHARYRYVRRTAPWWSPIGYGWYGWYGYGWWRGPGYGRVIVCP
jgi:hypothetical protein